MKLPIPSKLINFFRHRTTSVFWAGLIVIVLLEIWIIKGSVDIVLSANQILPVPPSRQVRINFDVYNQILKRLQDSDAYQPQPVITSSPFGQSPGASGQ